MSKTNPQVLFSLPNTIFSKFIYFEVNTVHFDSIHKLSLSKLDNNIS